MTEVVVLEEYTLGRLTELGGRDILPVRADGGLILLGPVMDGKGVCVACAEDARLAVLGPTAPRGDPGMSLGGRCTPALRSFVDTVVGAIRAAPADYRDMVVAVRTDLATVATHRVRPRPDGCPACGPLPDDAAELAQPAGARGTGGEAVAVTTGALRQHNPLTTVDGLRAELYDLRHGPVTGVFRTGHLPLAMVSAELVKDRAVPDAGFGRTASFQESERVALFEAVERHNGMRPRRCRTVLESSFAELGPQRALDPARLGRYDPEHVRDPQFHLAPYDPEARIRWVHGWSHTAGRPVAVPEQVAYWALPAPGIPRYINETSNGCGLGNSLTEAVLHGLFEVAERDAFLMAWYARTPLRRLRVPGADPILEHLEDRLACLAYTMMFFDATNDMAVPAVIAMALYRGSGTGDRRPRAFFAAGAHPDPVAAMRSAAAELVTDIESTVDRHRRDPGMYQRDRLLRMLAEPALVRTMEDHVAVNALPEAAERYAFLLGDIAGETAEVDPAVLAEPLRHTDLRQLLDGYVARLAVLGLEVIAVQQSDPVTERRLGLHSAKVIVPGTLPMTFGHLYRRTLGLPRLLEVPHRLGRLPAVASYESLALHPHPFP